MASKTTADDPHNLNQFRDYLRILAAQQIAPRLQGKVDLSGIVQETLWEAHQEMARGTKVSTGDRLAWLRRILSNNLTDEIRRMTAGKRDIGREVSLQQSIEQSSMRLEAWLACDLPPSRAAEHEERVLELVAALGNLPEAQRESLVLHYWSGLTLVQIAMQIGRSREAVAGLIKRGVRQLRLEMDQPEGSHDGRSR